ncbi:MAG: Autoinducer 2 import system permease protein LsrD [Phycisphaerae bacterium]|nr:Autoinducer 2 import system permease protein LsrD [Phycisphaerae bacterium]
MTRIAGSREFALACLLLLMVVAVGTANTGFLSADSLAQTLVEAAPVIIITCGATLLIVSGEIDISLGAQLAFNAALLGWLVARGCPLPLVVAAVVLCGGLLGLCNGLLTALAGVPSILTTLATMSVLRGGTELIMGGEWFTDLPPALRFLGVGALGGAPLPVLVTAVCLAASWAVFVRTRFGRHLRAVGASPRNAYLAGIVPHRVHLAAFVTTGVLTAVATLVSVTQLSVIESGVGVGLELLVITCVVVGGTPIQGGSGSVTGAALAALLFVMLRKMLIYVKLGESAVYWERTIHGLLILAAVLAARAAPSRRTRAVAA